jgi:hypothetical protein
MRADRPSHKLVGLPTLFFRCSRHGVIVLKPDAQVRIETDKT